NILNFNSGGRPDEKEGASHCFSACFRKLSAVLVSHPCAARDADAATANEAGLKAERCSPQLVVPSDSRGQSASPAPNAIRRRRSKSGRQAVFVRAARSRIGTQISRSPEARCA